LISSFLAEVFPLKNPDFSGFFAFFALLFLQKGPNLKREIKIIFFLERKILMT